MSLPSEMDMQCVTFQPFLCINIHCNMHSLVSLTHGIILFSSPPLPHWIRLRHLPMSLPHSIPLYECTLSFKSIPLLMNVMQFSYFLVQPEGNTLLQVFLYTCTSISFKQKSQNGIAALKGMCTYIWGFPSGSMVKDPPTNAGDLCSIPWSGRSPGGGHGNPLSILAWRIPGTEEPGRLQSIGSQRVRHD